MSWAGFKSNTDQIEAIIIHPLLEDLQLYVIGHTRARTGKIRLHFLFVLKFRINSLALFEYPCSILHAHRITIGDWIFTSWVTDRRAFVFSVNNAEGKEVQKQCPLLCFIFYVIRIHFAASLSTSLNHNSLTIRYPVLLFCWLLHCYSDSLLLRISTGHLLGNCPLIS